MSEEPPAPRWRWLDRWCEPPWRALLLWAALAALSGWADDHGALRLALQSSVYFIDLQAKLSPTVSDFLLRLVLPINSFVLLVWFEPFVLRLNFVRGLAWLGLRLLVAVSVDVYAVHATPTTILALFSFAQFAWSVLAVSVLYQWRSRPWWSVAGGVLMALTCHALMIAGAFNWAFLASGLVYAAVVLFGTRRLPP